MEETPEQIERHIRNTKHKLSRNFNGLEETVKNTFDWRVQFDERPLTMVGLAFGSGLLLSALFPPRRSSGRRRREATGAPLKQEFSRHASTDCSTAANASSVRQRRDKSHPTISRVQQSITLTK
jgi:hypothetical protein